MPTRHRKVVATVINPTLATEVTISPWLQEEGNVPRETLPKKGAKVCSLSSVCPGQRGELSEIYVKCIIKCVWIARCCRDDCLMAVNACASVCQCETTRREAALIGRTVTRRHTHFPAKGSRATRNLQERIRWSTQRFVRVFCLRRNRG